MSCFPLLKAATKQAKFQFVFLHMFEVLMCVSFILKIHVERRLKAREESIRSYEREGTQQAAGDRLKDFTGRL